jgi:hypothetical protein
MNRFMENDENVFYNTNIYEAANIKRCVDWWNFNRNIFIFRINIRFASQLFKYYCLFMGYPAILLSFSIYHVAEKSRRNVFFYTACSSRYSTNSVGDVDYTIYDETLAINDCRSKYSIIGFVYRSIFLFRTL